MPPKLHSDNNMRSKTIVSGMFKCGKSFHMCPYISEKSNVKGDNFT